MEYTTPTIFSAQYLTSLLLGKSYVPPYDQTLNKKWNVALSTSPPPNSRPILKYLAIGNGGHTISNTNGAAPYLMNPITHRPNHIALYNHIPWVMRDLNNDLTPTERDNYRMRVQITAGGSNYIAYYLKVLDTSSTSPTISKITWNNGLRNTTAFSNSDAILNPTPISLTGSTQNSTDNYLAVESKIDIIFDTATVDAIKDACSKIYGTTDYAVISEVGLYQGIDVQISSTIGGNTVTHNESIQTQPTMFANMFAALEFIDTPATFSIDIGSLEPMRF